MKLLHLHLYAFGRFHDQHVHLQDGMNLICGENEAGKSTLHRFIRGMLFGFKREGVMRRYYTSELEQYRPWVGKDYRGSLEYEDEQGRRILIQRSFDPDETQILDAVTGKSMTKDFPMDSRKEYLFAQEHLGLNATIFDNTIFLAQLGGKTGKELAREVSGRLASLSASGREDLSVQQAISDLQKKRDEIGSARAATRPLGRMMQLCEKLEKEEKDTAAGYQALRGQLEDIASLERQQQSLTDKHAVLSETLERVRRIAMHADGQRALELWHEREDAMEEIEKVQDFAAFPEHLREDFRDTLTRLETVEKSIADLQQQDQRAASQETILEREIQNFPADIACSSEARRKMAMQWAKLQADRERCQEEEFVLSRHKQRRQLVEDQLQDSTHLAILAEKMDRLEEDDETLRSLQTSSLPAEIQDAERSQVRILKRLRQNALCAGGFAVSGAVAAYYAYGMEWMAASAGFGGIFLMAVLVGTQKYRINRSRFQKEQNQHKVLVNLFKEEQTQLETILQNRQAVLTAAGVENLRSARQRVDEFVQKKDSLRNIHEDIRAAEEKMALQERQLRNDEMDLRRIMGRILPEQKEEPCSETLLEACLSRMDKQQEQIDDLQRLRETRLSLAGELEQLHGQQARLDTRRSEILQAGGVSDWAGFMSGCAKCAQYRTAMGKCERLDIQLEPYLRKRSISQWQAAMMQDPLTSADLAFAEEDPEKILEQADEIARQRQEVDIRRAAAKADMERALAGYRELAEIQEELAGACQRRAYLESEAAALDTALAALERAAETRHRLLAPELNRRVGDIISHLTRGRYRKVRIDEELAVTVSTPEDKRQVDLTALSAGTVDQFYFAVRVAMADLISQNRKLPLFMDDPFMQYSTDRLQEVLRFVGDLARERQILLFTCRDQEQAGLDAQDIPYHRIRLSE
jgi:hypothetical protein